MTVDEPRYDEGRTRLTLRRTLMDHGFMTHALLWLIGAMAAVGGLLTVAAFWSMGRANYRGD